MGRWNISPQVKSHYKEEPNNPDRENSKNAPANFSTVGVRSPKGPRDAAGHEKQGSGHKQQSDPREITCDGVSDENREITDESRNA